MNRPLFVTEAPVPRCKPGAWRDPLVQRWLAFALGSLVACVANLEFTLFGPWVILFWGIALLQGIRVPTLRTATFLLLVYVTLRHARNVNLIALVAPVLLAKPLGQHWAHITTNALNRLVLRDRPDQRSLAFACAAARIVTTGGLHALYRPPAASGALIRHGIKVYIDSRFDLYGAKFAEDYAKLISLTDSDTALHFTQECRARGTLLPPAMPLVAYLDLAPGWHRLYHDESYVVHVNDNCDKNATPGEERTHSNYYRSGNQIPFGLSVSKPAATPFDRLRANEKFWLG